MYRRFRLILLLFAVTVFVAYTCTHAQFPNKTVNSILVKLYIFLQFYQSPCVLMRLFAHKTVCGCLVLRCVVVTLDTHWT